MGAPVVHFEVNSRDARRAQEFYGNLFGWKIDANNPLGYGVVNTGVKMGINGGIGQVEEGKSPFATFYVQVEKPQEYLDKAVSMGARVITPVTVIPNMVTYALFADLEGNVVGIVEGPETPPREKRAKPKRARRKKASPRRKARGRKRRR